MQVVMQEQTAAPQGNLVTIEGLYKSFGSAVVLQDVSLTVKKGEAVVIVGSSGSGKSTCLRCINRLEEPTAGRIIVGGQEATGRGVDLTRMGRESGRFYA